MIFENGQLRLILILKIYGVPGPGPSTGVDNFVSKKIGGGELFFWVKMGDEDWKTIFDKDCNLFKVIPYIDWTNRSHRNETPPCSFKPTTEECSRELVRVLSSLAHPRNETWVKDEVIDHLNCERNVKNTKNNLVKKNIGSSFHHILMRIVRT